MKIDETAASWDRVKVSLGASFRLQTSAEAANPRPLKSMKSHLLDAESPKPDFIVYILFLFLIYLSFFEYEQQIGFLVYGLVVTAKIIWNMVQIFSKFRNYWVWWNLH